MDLLLNMVKGHHVEKVNTLEEKNRRLLKYNKDLRNELARHNRVTIKTSDEDENDDEDQDSSADSVADTYMVPSSCFNNALVMDKVFGYLDVKQLKDCRLICKYWNEAASSIFSKLNSGNGLGVHLALPVLDVDEESSSEVEEEEVYDDDEEVDDEEEEDDEQEKDDEYIEDGYIKKAHSIRIDPYTMKKADLKRIQDLHSTVEAAPENWFRTVSFDDSRWTRDPFKGVFQDFGKRMRVIKFTSEDIRIQALRSILLDWCPNLEEFAFGKPDIRFEADRDLKISRPLKLTRLSFKVNSIFTEIPFVDVAEIIFTIIKNSPSLKKLESLGSYTKVAKHLFTKMKNRPQIMNNMEEVFFKTASFNRFNIVDLHSQDPLETLSEIQFESKLKTLVLTELKPGQSIALNRLLNMTKESLEKLILVSNKSIAVRDMPASIEDGIFQLQQMNCLREFRYHAHRQGMMNSIDILAKMPKLEIFVLGFENQYSTAYRDDFIDRMFSICRRLMKNPHQNLKELYLFGYIQNPKDTYDVIQRGFPNLTKLVVRICYDQATNYSELFKGMSKLTKLNNLFLDLSTLRYDSKASYKIGRIFSYFKKLSNLTHLTLRGVELDLDEAIISKIPKLQRLILIEVKMDLVKAKKLVELLDERGVFLDSKEEYELMWTFP